MDKKEKEELKKELEDHSFRDKKIGEILDEAKKEGKEEKEEKEENNE